jgi:dipeptidyl-peptidase-4
VGEALQASAVLSGRSGPRGVVWLDGGTRFSFINTDPRTRRTEIRSYDPVTGRDTTLFSGEDSPSPAAPAVRVRVVPVLARFQESRLPVQLPAALSPLRYRGLSTSTHSPTASCSSRARARVPLSLSPNGTMLGEERNGDMYVVDLATHRERRLTTDATENVYNGHFDWVYEEEFGMAQAWNWSPDSRRIAFWQIDESKEPSIQLSDYSGRHQTWDRLRIPQPATPIPPRASASST